MLIEVFDGKLIDIKPTDENKWRNLLNEREGNSEQDK